jgi:acyl carrier protein
MNTMTTAASSSIRDTIREFIGQSIDISELADDVNLFESGIVNSLFAVQLMTFLEKHFGFEVSMEDLEIRNFQSVEATAAFVQAKLSAIGRLS